MKVLLPKLLMLGGAVGLVGIAMGLGTGQRYGMFACVCAISVGYLFDYIFGKKEL